MCKFISYVTGNISKESGPVSMTFTIPMYNVSQLQVHQHVNLLLFSFSFDLTKNLLSISLLYQINYIFSCSLLYHTVSICCEAAT